LEFKMHIYLITRGIKSDVDRFINDLRGKYLPFKDALNRNLMVQTAVRPIQFWEIVFPKEHRDIMLTTIFDKNLGKTQHSKHQKWLWALRKVLGADPIPEYKTDQFLPIYKQNIEMVGVGIKEDGDLKTEAL